MQIVSLTIMTIFHSFHFMNTRRGQLISSERLIKTQQGRHGDTEAPVSTQLGPELNITVTGNCITTRRRDCSTVPSAAVTEETVDQQVEFFIVCSTNENLVGKVWEPLMMLCLCTETEKAKMWMSWVLLDSGKLFSATCWPTCVHTSLPPCDTLSLLPPQQR